MLNHELGKAAVYVLGQFWVRYRRIPLSTNLQPRAHKLQAGDRLPDYQLDHNGRRIRLHNLTARAGLHVPLARDADTKALDSTTAMPLAPCTPARQVARHRRSDRSTRRLRRFLATSVEANQIEAWLARVGVFRPDGSGCDLGSD